MSSYISQRMSEVSAQTQKSACSGRRLVELKVHQTERKVMIKAQVWNLMMY